MSRSDGFRLERQLAGRASHPLGASALARRTKYRTLASSERCFLWIACYPIIGASVDPNPSSCMLAKSSKCQDGTFRSARDETLRSSRMLLPGRPRDVKEIRYKRG